MTVVDVVEVVDRLDVGGEELNIGGGGISPISATAIDKSGKSGIG